MADPLHIGILSLPGNPHCRKWAGALAAAGARVTVFSFELGEIPNVAVQVIPASTRLGGRYRYPSYWQSRKLLSKALDAARIDILHPLHLTPFGSWAHWSRFRPVIAAAIGADVLDYPPLQLLTADMLRQNWDLQKRPGRLSLLKRLLQNRFYRRQVQKVAKAADAFTVDNQTLGEALYQWFHVPADKIHILRWGVDTALADSITQANREAIGAQLGIFSDARIILSPRGLRPIYQAEELLAGFRQYLARGGRRTIVVLKGPYEADEALCETHRAVAREFPNKFLFVEAVLDAAEMATLLTLANAVVNAPIYDGYSAVLAEARYAGALPIVNDIPAHHELFDAEMPAVWLRDIRPESIVQALNHADALPEHIQTQWQTKHRDWILAHSTLQAAATQFLDLCKAVIHQHTGSTEKP